MASVFFIIAIIPVFGQRQAKLFDPGSKVEKVAGGFSFTEGPAADKLGNVYFTDQPNNRIMKWSINGTISVFLENSGRVQSVLYFLYNSLCSGTFAF